MYLQFCLPDADDLKMCCRIKIVVDFKRLQSDIDCIQKWRLGV